MITIFINGHPQQVADDCHLQQAITQGTSSDQTIDLTKVAAVLNQTIIPKSLWKEQSCADGDQIEIFSAVAGG
jgi:sulfur carrier protein